MNEILAEKLRRLGYRPQPTEVLSRDNGASVAPRRQYVAIAVKETTNGRVSVAKHLGMTEDDAEDKLVRMLMRP